MDSEDRQEKSNKLRDLKAAKSLRMYNLNAGNKDEGRWKMMFKFSSLGNGMDGEWHQLLRRNRFNRKLLILFLVC